MLSHDNIISFQEQVSLKKLRFEGDFSRYFV